MTAGGDRPRVAIVRFRGVFEAALYREARAFVDAGCDVDVFMLAGDEEPGLDGVTVHRLPGAKARVSKLRYGYQYAAYLVRLTVALAREHRRRPFDLVHVLSMPDFLVFCTVPLGRRVRTSLFLKEPAPELGYTIYGSARLRWVLRVVERASIRFADVVFTVTPELREAHLSRGVAPAKIHAVLNVVDEDQYAGSRVEPRVDHDRFVLVSHGTIEERWGHETMVRAVALVADDVPEIELRLIGRGTFIEPVLELARQLGVERHVTYLGWLALDDVLAEIAGADAGLVAQLANPYSHLVHTQKMFEFVMVDTPCIATRLRATRAAFDEGELLFVEPGSPESLAAAVRRLHAEPELGRELVRRARARYEAGYRWSDQQRVLVEHALGPVASPAGLSRRRAPVGPRPGQGRTPGPRPGGAWRASSAAGGSRRG